MEIEVLYYGEVWLWPYGEVSLIGQKHVSKLNVLIKRKNITRIVKLENITKYPPLL